MLSATKDHPENANVRARFSGIDAVLLVAAGAFSLFSWTYPFERDQGLYHYVGREWFMHGALPYRDLVEQKPPGVFIVAGLSARAFGDRMWPVRVLERIASRHRSSSGRRHVAPLRPP